MKPEEINKAIFRSLGWSIVEDSPYKGCSWNKGAAYTSKPPNYAESLDACAEFERTLTPRELAEYSYGLMDITRTTYEAITATAAQRCEAYLRMKGLWNE